MTSSLQLFAEQEIARGTLNQGRVDTVEEDGVVVVEMLAGGELVECGVLAVADGATLSLSRGDDVLFWTAPTGRGVILGRIGSRVSTTHEAMAPEAGDRGRPSGNSLPAPSPPDTLLLEARESLTLRVGDGSITIRADGKILIKGEDLVSHAKNLNRIKGGAVAIN